MSTLAAWNQLPETEAAAPVLACCGSRAFAAAVAQARPFTDLDSLLTAADRIWWSLAASDWLEAFACHPRIGESKSRSESKNPGESTGHSSSQFAAWSAQEQAEAHTAAEAVLESIARKNREYEARHGFIYIVCASGRSAEELLAVLDRRLGNSTESELREAAEQQRQITRLRLRKWLEP